MTNDLTDKLEDNVNDSTDDSEDSDDSILGGIMSKKEYLEACQKQLSELASNPDALRKAVGPFMEAFDMQQKLDKKDEDSSISNMGDFSKMFSGLGAGNSNEELKSLIKKVGARVVRLEKRLEESGVLKPRDE